MIQDYYTHVTLGMISEMDTYEKREFCKEFNGKNGIYFLLDIHNVVVYIGISYDLGSRVRTHIQKGEKEFIFVKCIEYPEYCDYDILEPHERALICTLLPKYNQDALTKAFRGALEDREEVLKLMWKL